MTNEEFDQAPESVMPTNTVKSLPTKDLLDLVLTKARRQPGMASVSVAWHPYERRWIAKADWCNDVVVEIRSKCHADPDDALQELSRLLDDPTLKTDLQPDEIVEKP